MSTPVLELSGIGKSYFGSPVLRDVGFSLGRGEALGLVGENGAGKSTLMGIVGGVVAADSGTLRLDGRPYLARSPHDARRQGIALVHQELNLFSNLTVEENVFLTDLPLAGPPGLRLIRRGELRRRCAAHLDELGLSIDPGAPVEGLSPGERQLVEIAKALRGHPRIVVFDEPTTSLGRADAARVFDLLARLRRDGVAVVYVSHNLDDVLRVSDRVVVLRDGEIQAVRAAKELDKAEMISLMVGRRLDTLFPEPAPPPSGDVVLEARGLSRSGVVEDVSFELRGGEVLGLAGLMGSGRTELARILYGLDHADRGQVRLFGDPVSGGPRVRVGRGMGLLPEDRRKEGLLLAASLADNVALACLDDLGRGPVRWLARAELERRVESLRAALEIVCRSVHDQPVRTLSGGNQQKAVLARWLAAGARVLVLDEPTRGVDMGARQQIYEQIRVLVAGGAAVLLISSELEELQGLCHRVLVLSRGEVQAVVERADFEGSRLLRAAFGEAPDRAGAAS